MFFDDYYEFVDLDERKKRQHYPVTVETLTRRCESILPVDLVSNKTVLDIGSALGAMGHWALSKGAVKYRAIEKNDYYRNTSIELLKQYHSNFSITDDLEQVNEMYDIVIAAGVIHGFLDPFPVLKKICDLSNKYVIIETMVYNSQEPVMGFQENNMINPKDINEPYSGISGILSKSALIKIMGFYDHGVLWF